MVHDNNNSSDDNSNGNDASMAFTFDAAPDTLHIAVSHAPAVPLAAPPLPEHYDGSFTVSRLTTFGRGNGATSPFANNQHVQLLFRDVPIDFMSFVHFMIVKVGADWHVFDVGSTTGVFVNNRRITETQELADGDCIETRNTVASSVPLLKIKFTVSFKPIATAAAAASAGEQAAGGGGAAAASAGEQATGGGGAAAASAGEPPSPRTTGPTMVFDLSRSSLPQVTSSSSSSASGVSTGEASKKRGRASGTSAAPKKRDRASGPEAATSSVSVLPAAPVEPAPAPKKGPDSRILQEFSCPICLSPHLDPVTLSTCGHTMCRQCLLQHTAVKKNKHPAESQFCCPSCRASFDRRAPRNTAIQNVLDHVLKDDPEYQARKKVQQLLLTIREYFNRKVQLVAAARQSATIDITQPWSQENQLIVYRQMCMRRGLTRQSYLNSIGCTPELLASVSKDVAKIRTICDNLLLTREPATFMSMSSRLVMFTYYG